MTASELWNSVETRVLSSMNSLNLSGLRSRIDSLEIWEFMNEFSSRVSRVYHGKREVFKDVTASPDSQEIDANHTRPVISQNINEPTSTNLFTCLNEQLLFKLMSYLEPDEVCKLRQVDKFTQSVFLSMGEKYWMEINRKRITMEKNTLSDRHYATFLFNQEIIYQNEMKHVKALERQYQALASYYAYKCSIGRYYTNDVFGMVCDLVWFDTELLALAVSKVRHHALATIIVDTDALIMEFKKAVKPLIHMPSSFLPLDITYDAIYSSMDEYDYFLGNRSLGGVRGYIGHVVHLLRMHEKDEHLRFSAFALLFKNLVVFTTMELMNNYKSTLSPIEQQKFKGVALDEYAIDELKLLYPRFRYESSRPVYYKNYPFLGLKNQPPDHFQGWTISDFVKSFLQLNTITSMHTAMNLSVTATTTSSQSTSNSSSSNSNSNNNNNSTNNTTTNNSTNNTNVGGDTSSTMNTTSTNTTTTTNPTTTSTRGSIYESSSSPTTTKATIVNKTYIDYILDDLKLRVENTAYSYTLVKYTY